MSLITWNPEDKHHSITLSNDNLTARVPNHRDSFLRAKYSNVSKWYCEVKIDSSTHGNIFGFCIATKDAEKTTRTLGLRTSSGGVYHESTEIKSTPDNLVVGDTLGIALDKINDKVSFYINGVIQGETPVFEYLETFELYPYVTTGASAATHTIFYTANFGREEFDIVTSNPEAWEELVEEGYVPYDINNADWFSFIVFLIKTSKQIITISENRDKLIIPNIENVEEITQEQYLKYGRNNIDGYDKAIDEVEMEMEKDGALGEGWVYSRKVNRDDFKINKFK